MQPDKFRELITAVLHELETMTCDKWSITDLQANSVVLESSGQSIKIRNTSSGASNSLEFSGVYDFPGDFAAKVRKKGPRQCMRVDKARPSLIANRILRKFRPALSSYEAQVRNWRRQLEEDAAVVRDFAAELEDASGGRLRFIESSLHSWSPVDPFLIRFANSDSELALSMTGRHGDPENPQDCRLTFTFSTEDTDLAVRIARLA